MQTTSAMQMPRARGDELIVKEFSDEVLVYDLRRHRAHCLNRPAALVWRQCDGQTSLAEIARAVGGELNAPIDEGVIWLALGQLGKAGLLHGGIAPSLKMSRREVVRKLGLAAALALPVVKSIVAPMAVQASSHCTVTFPGCTPATIGCCCSANGIICHSDPSAPDGASCSSSMGSPC